VPVTSPARRSFTEVKEKPGQETGRVFFALARLLPDLQIQNPIWGGGLMLRVRKFVGVVIPLLIMACAHPKPAGPSAGSGDVITEDEIAASSAANAFEVVRKLRANFFSSRGKTSLIGTSSSDPTVYVDDQAYGPISSLRTIPASQITSIRLYRSWEATTKYGMGNMGGVIAVATKQ
jgi:TonB-dependent Receptor Plug Domain